MKPHFPPIDPRTLVGRRIAVYLLVSADMSEVRVGTAVARADGLWFEDGDVLIPVVDYEADFAPTSELPEEVRPLFGDAGFWVTIPVWTAQERPDLIDAPAISSFPAAHHEVAAEE